MPQTIAMLLQAASLKLRNVTDVPELEAEILLAHVLQVSRSYLYTWPEKSIEEKQEVEFQRCIVKRINREPIAYITGHREFWSLDLSVTPSVLIPRPETELLVELALQKIQTKNALIADLGTGSGAISLALASERPNWSIYATDKSHEALDIAKQNAERLHLTTISFYQGEWCEALPQLKYDAIVSNPPYLAQDDPHLQQGDLRFEPLSALASGQQGLDDIREIIQSARDYLKPQGLLLLEHGYTQAQKVSSIFQEAGYNTIEIYQDFAGQDRVTIASYQGLI
jgi:release factor glutamine methyltransferase